MDNFNEISKHKTFISFRNPEAAWYKDKLVALSNTYNIFDDYSIGKGDIERSDYKTDGEIRKVIIQDWMSKATVTILLVSSNMSESKFIDWEMQATMSNNENNSKMGLVCIFLPKTYKIKNLNANTSSKYSNLVKTIVDSNPQANWPTINRNTIDEEYYDLPSRVRKNIKRESVHIDIVSWSELFKNGDEQAAVWLKQLIDKAFEQGKLNKYDFHDELQKSHK